MPLYRLVLLLLLASGLLPLAASAQLLPGGRTGSAVVVTERVRAELLAHAPEGVAPGKPVWLGLQIAHQPQWHTYWKNPGDSGLPTVLDWQLPAGLTAGEIRWPVPRKIPIGHLANYGYEGTVLLPVPLEVGASFPGTDATVRLKATWLVCKQECIPEEGEFTLRLPASGSMALHGPVFEAAFSALPESLPPGTGASARVEDGALSLRVDGLPATLRGQRLELFPEVPGVTEPAAEWTQAWEGEAWTARLPLSQYRSASPQVLPVVLATGSQGWRAELSVAGAWPPVATQAAVPDALQEALRQNAARAGQPPGGVSIGLWAALAGALVGGLILNLMPCVFPILAIKMLSFTARADNLGARRASGLAYSAGVVLSFVALGAGLLALRAAGEQLGWGFQLQSPAVIAGLALLFTLLALNLSGMFEFGALLPSSLASREVRHPVGNSFLSGVLAVAVASPCTAPFMGASLGLAIVLPPAQALAVFATLGLGMALPYLLATWVPAVAGLLPRPGPWMQTFRQLMAFPLFATVAWLVWVLGQQSGIDGAGALLALLVGFSLLVWALTLRGRTRGVLAGFAALALAALAWTVGPTVMEPPPQAAARADGSWEPWSESRVRELVAAGRPVFVDFTAAWCITCQYNKQTTLADAGLLAEMRERRVALLRADWTRRDPAITEALQSLGRSGVPVYAVYQGDGPPRVLSEILSVAEVRAAIAAP
jgi:thiol:disulfide interchange protein